MTVENLFRMHWRHEKWRRAASGVTLRVEIEGNKFLFHGANSEIKYDMSGLTGLEESRHYLKLVFHGRSAIHIDANVVTDELREYLMGHLQGSLVEMDGALSNPKQK